MTAPASPRLTALHAEWRRLGYETDETMGYVLERSATSWPHRVAVITSREVVTFLELQERSSSVARTLINAGVAPGDAVAWMLPTDVDAIVVASALWRIGAVSCPIVPLYGPREMGTVIRQVTPTAVITRAGNFKRDLPAEFDQVLDDLGHVPVARLITRGASVGWIQADRSGPGSLPTAALPTAASDPCLVLYTSGTEAEPKGVLHTPAGIQQELRSTITEWGLTFRDRMVMASPLTHITGLLQGFMIPARVGASAVLMDRWDAAECVALIEQTGATYMAGATPFLRELLAAYDAVGAERSSLRQYCCGGASVPPELIRRIGELGVAGYRAWGMTEIPTATLANELDPLELRAETEGRVAPGVEIRVVDDNGHQVPRGQIGELCVRGPEMMRGYVDQSLNARALTEDGWLRSGDLGSFDGHGRLRFSGRLKNIINRGGEKFSTLEIEEALGRHPDVEAAAVVAVPGGRLGEKVGAVVVSARDDLTLDDLGRTILGQGLARQKQPEVMRTVDRLPTNATGKLDRPALIELLEEVEPG